MIIVIQSRSPRGVCPDDMPKAERDAAPAGGLVTSHSGGVGAPPGWPLRAACQELADDPGQCPDESAARRWSKNAAVKRREARRPTLLAGGPFR